MSVLQTLTERYMLSAVPREGEGGGGGGDGGGGNPPPAAWHQGKLEGELLGHAQNRGWDRLPPDQAAVAAIKAHAEAERYIGVPADRIIRVPADQNDTEGWKAVYKRLGKPDDAKDYDFSTVKFEDGTELSEDFVSFLRTTAFEHNLSKEAAVSFAKAMVKWTDEGAAADATVDAGRLAEQKAELRKSWGQNWEVNNIIAQKAAENLGLNIEQLNAAKDTFGYVPVMQMLLTIGQKIGEDAFIRNLTGNSDAPRAFTKEQAQARLKELQSDTEWQSRFFKGGAKEKQEHDALTRIIVGA